MPTGRSLRSARERTATTTASSGEHRLPGQQRPFTSAELARGFVEGWKDRRASPQHARACSDRPRRGCARSARTGRYYAVPMVRAPARRSRPVRVTKRGEIRGALSRAGGLSARAPATVAPTRCVLGGRDLLRPRKHEGRKIGPHRRSPAGGRRPARHRPPRALRFSPSGCRAPCRRSRRPCASPPCAGRCSARRCRARRR